MLTVAELKSLVADLPDDMPVAVYSESLDKSVNFGCRTIYDDEGWSGIFPCPTFVIIPKD